MSRESLLIRELCELLNSSGARVLDRLLALLDEHDGGVPSDAELPGKVSLGVSIELGDGVGLGVLLGGAGKVLPDGGEVPAVAAPGGVELDHHELVLLELLVEGLGGEHKDIRVLAGDLVGLLGLGLGGGGRGNNNLGLDLGVHDLLLEELGPAGHITRTTVLDGSVLALKKLDGGEATDAKLVGGLGVHGAVDLGNMVEAVGGFGKLLPVGGHALAVPAPGCKELDEPDALLDLFVKGVVGKNLNVGTVDSADGEDGEEKRGDKLHFLWIQKQKNKSKKQVKN